MSKITKKKATITEREMIDPLLIPTIAKPATVETIVRTYYNINGRVIYFFAASDLPRVVEAFENVLAYHGDETTPYSDIARAQLRAIGVEVEIR
jgi:hypothetical protein